MPKLQLKLPKRKPRAALPEQPREPGPRRLQLPKRIWYKPLTWRHRPPVPAYKPLPKARILFATTIQQLWSRKKLFFPIMLVYGVLNLLFVRGLSGSYDLTSLRQLLENGGHGIGAHLGSSAVTFLLLLGTSGSGSTTVSGVYQVVLFVICSLAFIWALRQVLAKHKARFRDSFYLGMYPLIPFVLILALIGIQLVPLLIGGNIYSIVLSNGIAVHAWEKLLWVSVFILLTLWSLRMITATLFALYIVTLPDMAPLTAYRSARKLVYGRRLMVWRKLIFLPIVLVLLAALIELPLILFLTPVAAWTFFALTMLALPIIHGYLYNLYREML